MTYQVVIQVDPPTTPLHYVIGVGPFPPGTTDADFGDGYHIVNLADEQVVVTETYEFCYLSTDGLSLYGGPQPRS